MILRSKALGWATPKRLDGRLALPEKMRLTFTDSIQNKADVFDAI